MSMTANWCKNEGQGCVGRQCDAQKIQDLQAENAELHATNQQIQQDYYERGSEISELREQLENEQAKGVHSCGPHCQRPMCVLRRENAELRERAEKAEAENERLTAKCGEYDKALTRLAQSETFEETDHYKQILAMSIFAETERQRIAGGRGIMVDPSEVKHELTPREREDFFLRLRLLRKIESLQAENAELRAANESFAVCAKHVPDATTGGCLVCEVEELRAKLERVRNFHYGLEIAKSVFDGYRTNHPRWWHEMNGTPILNDIAVRMAQAFSAALSDSEETNCNHKYVDPTNEVVDANGHLVCIYCGKLDSEESGND